MEDFIHLTEAIHKAGMKVMLDVVYNHTSPDSWLSENHPEWFYHKADGSFGNRIGEWWDVIDLDYSNMDLWDYQIDTLKMWAQYVDGFRCDVAPILPIDFWIRARKEIAEMKDNGISKKCVGLFSTSGCKQSVRVELPDGVYKNMIDGKEVDVFEKTVAFMGEPVVIML